MDGAEDFDLVPQEEQPEIIESGPKCQSTQGYELTSRRFYEMSIEPDPTPDQEIFKSHIDPWVTRSGAAAGLALLFSTWGWFEPAFSAFFFSLVLAAIARYIYSTKVCHLLGKKALTPAEKFAIIQKQIEEIPDLGPVVYNCKPSLSDLRTLKVKNFTNVQLPDGSVVNLQRSITFNL